MKFNIRSSLMIQFLIMLAFMLIFSIGTASATDNGNHYGQSGGANVNAGASGSLWTGGVTSYAKSETVGGSGISTGVAGNGYTSQSASNAGGGTSSAGGSINSNGVATYSNTSSYSSGYSSGAASGNYSSSNAGGVGTDVSAGAQGSFTKVAGGFEVSGFINGSSWHNGNNGHH